MEVPEGVGPGLNFNVSTPDGQAQLLTASRYPLYYSLDRCCCRQLQLWHGTARKDGTDCHGGAPTDLPGWHFCWDDGILFVRSNCLSGFFLVFAILDGNRYFPVEERQEDSGHLATSTTMLCP